MMMTSEEQSFLLSHVNNHSLILEYGSGDSSFELAQQASSVISIEHDENWYIKGVQRKEILRHIERALWPYLNIEFIYAPPDKEMEDKMSDGSEEEFATYIKAGWERGPYNIVIIDGRSRVACVRHIVENYTHYFNPMCGDIKFFVHDCVVDPAIIQDREKNDKPELRTNEIYKYLTKVEAVGSLVQFKFEDK